MDALFARPVYKTVWAQIRRREVLPAARSDSPFDEKDVKDEKEP